MNPHEFSRDPAVTAAQAARKLSLLSYGLYGLSFFTAGITGLIAIVINHIKYRDVRSTLYGSHFRWQMYTFWGSVLLWALLVIVALLCKWAGLSAESLMHAPALLLLINALWVIYRLVRGLVVCLEGRRMPV